MLNVLGCITNEHEPWLTALAVVICLAGMLTFVRLLRGALTATGISRTWWVGTSSVAGGGTIWATHFVTILAYRSSVPLAFNVELTIVSVVVAIAVTYLGAHIAAHAGPGRRWMQWLGGGIIGAGVGTMHFMGMRALVIPGTLTFYTASTVVSLMIGCGLAAGAVAILARHGTRWTCLAATLLFTVAIAGLHFTSMANTAIVLDGRAVLGWAPDGQWLAIAVTVATVVILAASAGTSLLAQNVRLRVADKVHMLELSRQSIRFQAALDNMTQGLCMFDAAGSLVVYNLRFVAMFGIPQLGATTASLEATLHLGGIFHAVDAQPGDPEGSVHQLPDDRMIQVSRQMLPDTGWVATFEDVTERRRARDQLSHMALHDALTGLPNRVKFREHMDCILGVRQRRDVAVLYLDLDGFKGVNDTLGHPVGDELLRAVAVRLRECTRETDLVARLGGDEFAIIQVGVAQFADMTTLCDRLVQAVQMPFDVHGHVIMIGTSIGVVPADETSDADELLRNADIALYRAKAAGRGVWRLFEPEMDAELQARRTLERDLRQALAEKQFELFYQPLINATSDILTGFEALLRWNHPQRGMVSPAEFIPVAEETGLIKEIGAWVLDRACADAVAWPQHVKIAVNLSPVQFHNGHLVHEVEQALASSGLAANRLELEVTESILLQDNDTILGMLHRLRGLGVRISMDDFGTGYSALSYLRRFPFDKIKIDQSFIRNLGIEKGSIEIIRAVVGLGQALSMEVLAEGVETADQLRRLQHAGCNDFQGYLFSRPKPIRDLAEIIASYVHDSEASAGPPAPPRLKLVGAQA